jgi:hypothetical protein
LSEATSSERTAKPAAMARLMTFSPSVMNRPSAGLQVPPLVHVGEAHVIGQPRIARILHQHQVCHAATGCEAAL